MQFNIGDVGVPLLIIGLIVILSMAAMDSRSSVETAEELEREREEQREMDRLCGPFFRVVGGEIERLTDAELEERIECRDGTCQPVLDRSLQR